MRFLLDENVPLAAGRAMRDAGHDVLGIVDIRPGMHDRDVLTTAVEQKRILVTLDRDFGELVFLQGRPVPPAVIFVRAAVADPVADLVAPLLDLVGRETLVGYLWVMNRLNWRQHPLPRREI